MSELLQQLGEQGQVASRELALLSSQKKNTVLQGMGQALLAAIPEILAANQKDLARGREKGTSESMLDRLLLTEERIKDMAVSMEQMAGLPDPIGEVMETWVNEAGLQIMKERVPLGVIGIIYEARPNVTVEAAGLCFKAGNAVLLRGGSEAIESNTILEEILVQVLKEHQLPVAAIQLVKDTTHEIAGEMMTLNEYLDVLIPRGGKRLIDRVVRQATVPVIETGTGNCHLYVDKEAQFEMAAAILLNGKASRPSVCNALETLLVHEEIAADFLAFVEPKLQAAQIELRADKKASLYLEDAILATEHDFDTEFLDYILAIRVVSSIEEAMAHIARYSTGHSEAIVTDNYFTARMFQKGVDAAAVYVNASTRFTDGFEFGFGGEIGISTQKLHARGPMGLRELTSFKYLISGDGQIRE